MTLGRLSMPRDPLAEHEDALMRENGLYFDRALSSSAREQLDFWRRDGLTYTEIFYALTGHAPMEPPDEETVLLLIERAHRRMVRR